MNAEKQLLYLFIITCETYLRINYEGTFFFTFLFWRNKKVGSVRLLYNSERIPPIIHESRYCCGFSLHLRRGLEKIEVLRDAIIALTHMGFPFRVHLRRVFNIYYHEMNRVIQIGQKFQIMEILISHPKFLLFGLKALQKCKNFQKILISRYRYLHLKF